MSNMWKLYIIRFFHNLIPAYVIERLFWEERGMTVPMVVAVELIYAAAIVLLEVPSGIAADKWGRKRLLLLSAVIGCLEFLLLVFAREFWHFALIIFLTAVGNSAGSGADNALLYDSLLEDGKQRDYEKYRGRLNALGIASSMIAALCGSVLAGHYGFEFNYWLSFASMLIALTATIALREPARPDGTTEEEPAAIPMRVYVTESLRFFRRQPAVFLAMLTGMTLGAAVNYIDEFWQLYLERLGVPVVSFGLFYALIALAQLPGNVIAYKLKDKVPIGKLLQFAVLATAAGMSFMAFGRSLAGIVAMLAVFLVAGMVEPLVSGYLHHRIDSTMRATIDSFHSLGLHAAIGVVGLGFGYFAAKLDLFGGFGFAAALCAALLLCSRQMRRIG